ncbi:MAG: 3-methylcrotonyl-CoA carboxylase, partial [Pseudooceanicola sp.]|nr:3-methylcrotonyl-CoA carboxylase [Pseudooceanicola sp.]
TGVDLVEWQLRVAAGETLPKRQEELQIAGHAFEARLYAEDVPKGFLPATGRLTHLAFPAGCRADSGVRAGDVISPWYDPMIAKVIVHGPTRAIALKRLSAALKGTEVAGTVTNLAFLGALAGHDGFARGDVDTGLIARDIDTLVVPPAPGARHMVAAAMAVADARQGWAQGFTLWAPLEQSVHLTWGDDPVKAVLSAEGPDRQVWRIGDNRVVAERQDGAWRVDGLALPLTALASGTVTVFDAYGLAFGIVDPLDRAATKGGDLNVIGAPMPGLVKAIFARAGQRVAEGDRLAILEAMKMEHSLLAARDGVVAEVLAQAGAQVEAGAALVRLETEE